MNLKKYNHYLINTKYSFYFLLIVLSSFFLVGTNLFGQKPSGQLLSIPWLPDPMLLKNHTPIETTAQWGEQKEWIKQQFQEYYLGYMPPIPDEVKAEVLNEVKDGEITIRTVELSFGKDWKAKMTVELYFPSGIQESQPVFMTQWNHREWLAIGLRRGYIGCLYAGADVKDDTNNYVELYPDYSFMELMQRAWGATAVVTYLHTLPFADTTKIAISGHSRNGKQSLYVAAFDDRIDAVIPSSSGFGGVRPSRFCGRRFSAHTMRTTFNDFPNWFLPDLKSFVGQTDQLPVDMNSLLAIVAPRSCLLNAGIFDLYGDAFGLEKSYLSARKAYSFHDASERIQIRQRVSRHTTQARDIENFFDFLDTQFGINEFPPFNDRYHIYDYQKWLEKNDHLSPDEIEKVNVSENENLQNSEYQQIIANINWLLGEKPPGITNPGPQSMSPRYEREDNLATMFRTQETIGDAKGLKISPYNGMGDNLFADFYYPDNDKEKYPLVIYLHEYDYASGYGRSSYPGFEMNDYINELTDAGFAVLAYDMIGFGTRQAEGVRFYERYPEWSLMGKMVEDAKAAIDVVYNLPVVDTTKVFLSGYSLGANVGLFTAALDERVNKVAVVSPFTPFRTNNLSIEGIRHFYDYFGLIPRLGLFEGYETDIPVDLQEILAASKAETFILLNEDSRHIEIDKMNDQIDYAARMNKIHKKIMPFDESFWQDHREELIDFLTK